jgi:hypothetical protein
LFNALNRAQTLRISAADARPGARAVSGTTTRCSLPHTSTPTCERSRPAAQRRSTSEAGVVDRDYGPSRVGPFPSGRTPPRAELRAGDIGRWSPLTGEPRQSAATTATDVASGHRAATSRRRDRLSTR